VGYLAALFGLGRRGVGNFFSLRSTSLDRSGRQGAGTTSRKDSGKLCIDMILIGRVRLMSKQKKGWDITAIMVLP